MSSIPYDRPEELLARTGWMRALATRLLADPAAADDVVQEAWLAALEHPPRANEEAWLTRVVRNFAWKRRRGEGRRAAHERALPVAEPHPGPEATAERLELQRTVLDAVAAIDEPFRTAVVERYLQGRTSADIARALGVPEGTVRWRLKRGLDELRARLDVRFGGREAWSALLLPLALPPGPVPTGGAAPGGSLASPVIEPGILAMLGVSKIVLASLVGAAALGLVLWRPGAERRGDRPVAELEGTAPVERAPERGLETPSEAPSEPRVARAAAPKAAEPPRPAPPEVVAEARATHALLALRFVDAQGAPWQDVDVGERFGNEVRTRSDADGRAELSFETSSQRSEWIVVLSAQRAGCATRQMRVTVTAGRTTDLGDVVLEPGARIEGRVLDEVGGVIAEAEVGLGTVELFDGHNVRQDETYVRRQGSAGFDRTLTTRSAADGSFVLEGVAPGPVRLWAHGTDTRYGWTEPFEVLAGEDAFGMDVRLPGLLATDTISGIVLDPLGEPLPSAQLLFTYQFENESGTTTEHLDEDGRFQIVIQRETRYSFVASDREGRYEPAYAHDVAPGTQALELRLAEKRTFVASVRDREGRAVEGCRFALSVHVGGGVSRDEPTPTLVEPGLYSLPLPSVAFDLEVEADGFLPALFEAQRPETVGARFEVTLDTAPRLKGRVVAEGRPVAGARVTLHRSFEGQGYWRDGFPCLYDAASVREVTCDERGRFELTCRSNAPVRLRASSAGYAIGELGPLDPLMPGELTLELTAGGSIEGRVLLPDDADATGVVVGLNHGDGHPRTLRAGPEGRFRFDALAPGPWQVLRRDAEIDPSSTTTMTTDEPYEIEWSCTVEAGRTTRYDLDLSRP